LLIIGPSDNTSVYIKNSIKDFLNNLGMISNTDEEIFGAGKSIILTIKNEIQNADLVIADMSRANSNVMYEIGYAHAIQKPVLLIINRYEKIIPSNLRGYYYFVYDNENIEELMNLLINQINNIENYENVWG